MKKQAREITSLHELQRRVPSFVQAINADERLVAGAAANPLFALEELGVTISPEFLPTVIRRIRFSLEVFNRLESLAERVHKLANRRFDIDSPSELARILFDELKLPRPGTGHGGQVASTLHQSATGDTVADPLPYSMGKLDLKIGDPLDELRDLHPIIEPLLEYRRLEATTPRLATRDAYRAVRAGEIKLPFKRLRVSLKRGPTPE